MKKVGRFIPIEQLMDSIQPKKLNTWLDRLKFIHIFFLWITIIFIFAFAYQFFTGETSYLRSSATKEPVTAMIDVVYFSFITATSTGFGDIVPVGDLRIVSIVEVIFGLILLALVTSKLVSLKQDIILNEIYEISFNEKVFRLRSSLLLFRQNIGKISSRAENNKIRKRDTHDLQIHISLFEDTLHEMMILVNRSKHEQFTKMLDPVNQELLANSIITSLEKLFEVLTLLEEANAQWKLESIKKIITNSAEKANKLFNVMNSDADMTRRKNKIIKEIQELLDN